MQVQFTHLKCFIEEEGKVIAQGAREGRMFILKMNDTKDTKLDQILTYGTRAIGMFAKGYKVESDIDLWHKQFWPCQLPAVFGNANEEHCFQLVEIQWPKGPSLCRLLVKVASLIYIPK